VAAAIARLQIDTRAQGEVQRLSGGNQQKVTIGRWMAHGVGRCSSSIPRAGSTCGRSARSTRSCASSPKQGAAVLYYTSELEEVPLACDRALVIFNGRVVDVIEPAEADEAR
jgi:ribose transport system ATP-binding protein